VNSPSALKTISANDEFNVVIAGASGYIGRELIHALLKKYPKAKITALSRSINPNSSNRIQWKNCDLFSLKSIESSVPPRVDIAFYLVHSMAATARLDQGSFADYDLILADNFCRAIKGTGVQQVIYLGGIIPNTKHISLHLKSRLEMEETFQQYQLPTTILRAGLILGEFGSSTQILIKLVKRLPFMICPQWTQTQTSPVDLQTVINNLVSLLENLESRVRIYDIAGCPPLSYIDMMRLMAKKMGLFRFFLKVPFFSPTLSKLWVSLITNSPKELVYPLVESLEHPMVADSERLISQKYPFNSFEDLIKDLIVKPKPRKSLFKYGAQRSTVRSLQRIDLPENKDALWVKEQYIYWLPKFLKPFIIVDQKENITQFCFLNKKVCLLELTLIKDRSHLDRQLLFITDGLLVSKNNKGRFEFRVILHRKYVIAAIHDFEPALPWYVYKFTQAQLHLLVMSSFKKYLYRKNKILI
jgi:nucleoside-diphosphate-sugar epimerase